MYYCTPVDHKENPGKLYVVTAISNSCRYDSRYKLYQKFEKMVKDSGAILYTVETAFGKRPHAVTDANNPCHIQLRTNSEIWHKENMLNIGISHLPQDWQYVAWVDADVSFARPDWANETINQLQHYNVVQMFSMAHDLTPTFTPFQKHKSFMYCYKNSHLKECSNYVTWHPGFAWAATRKTIDHLGGLIDIAILGAADRHMAHGLIGRMKVTIHKKLSSEYARELLLWEERAEKYVLRNVGYVDGLLLHYWHGHKRDRRYAERWQILINNNYDPRVDLKRDWQLLWQLTENNPNLRDEIRHYFLMRNEDSIDLEPSDIKI